MNTKERHLEILGTCHQVIKMAGGVEKIDALNQDERPSALLKLAKAVEEQTGCHRTTAKNNVARALRRARYKIMKAREVEELIDLIEEAEWGGKRPGAGPPLGNQNQNWAKRRASSDK
ncbi:MAG: hypothetical protein ACYSQZ_06680 [Planctomycetota bacterium]